MSSTELTYENVDNDIQEYLGTSFLSVYTTIGAIIIAQNSLYVCV